MPTIHLTQREKEFVTVLERMTRSLGYSPSMREVAARMGIRETRARSLARAAEAAGLVTHTEGTARSWRLTGKK